MREYLSQLATLPLFAHLDEEGIARTLSCLEAYTSNYQRGQPVFLMGEPIIHGGILLSGEVLVGISTAEGNEHTMRSFQQGELFGAAYACVPAQYADVQMVAQEESTVLFLKLSNLFEGYATRCPCAAQVTANLLRITAQSNLIQQQKIKILSQRHIRERIITYFTTCAEVDGKVHLPFNRQELANYLGVDRSALSRELSKMKEEGLLDYRKNTFTLDFPDT